MKPEELIKSIRQSFVGAEHVYTQGSCVMFYMILKTAYPNAKPYWSKKASHMITKIGAKFYDITGEVDGTEDYVLDEDEWSSVSVAVALPQSKQRRHCFTTPRKL